MRTPLRSGPRSAFTLIEVLAVIVIIGILAVFLLPNLIGHSEAVKAQATSAFLRQIDAALSEYNHEFGAYPRGELDPKWGIDGNGLNEGAECLVLQLWSKEWAGSNLPTDRFTNVDGDFGKNTIVDPTVIASGELFELKDAWDNPIAYIPRSRYGEKSTYVSRDGDTGVEVESILEAAKDSRTGAYCNPRKYQLVSAGEDGVFGTEDDLTNYDRGDG